MGTAGSHDRSRRRRLDGRDRPGGRGLFEPARATTETALPEQGRGRQASEPLSLREV
jgi:hypothetical protein